MPYWQLFYHLVWGTKYREPLITAQLEPLVHHFLREKASELGGTVLALNGIVDHVHLVVAIPPTIAVCKFVGQIKGFASNQVNKSDCDNLTFAWQPEYGAFSCDHKSLPYHCAYVAHQKQHHAQNTLIPALELGTKKQTHSQNHIHESFADYQVLQTASIEPAAHTTSTETLPSVTDVDFAAWLREMFELPPNDD